MTNDVQITPQEDADYNAFCAMLFQRIERTPPEVLWYYTAAETFADIVHNKQIWSTQVACLNDHTEFRLGVNLVRTIIRAFGRDEKRDDLTRWLAGEIEKGLAEDGAEFSYFYVLCTSFERDDLSQWRAYGSGEGGVAIGFHGPSLLRPDIRNRPMLVPVIYERKDQEWLAAAIAGQTFVYFKEGLERRPGVTKEAWAEVFLPAWRDKIIYFAPMLKDEAFRGEREWRLICTLTTRRNLAFD